MIFDIAGVRFALNLEEFQSKASETSATAADVHIRLQPETIASPKARNLLFENGTSLKVFHEGQNYRFLFSSSGSLETLWDVLLNADASDATVYAHAKIWTHRKGMMSFLCEKLPRMLLIRFLALREGWLFHAGAVEIAGKGYLFPGESGTGKSTLARQFIHSNYGSVLNDDRVVIRKIQGKFEAFGTPWTGDSGIVSDAKVPLCGIFFIKHAPYNEIREIRRADALQELLASMTLPWYDANTLSDMLAYSEELMVQVPMYTLYCTADGGAIKAIKKFADTRE